MGMARSMMKAISMPGWFWGEAVTTAVSILNRSTQSVEGKTPYEVWHGHQPTVHFFRTFGCVAHVKAGGKPPTKLEDGSTPMVFVGHHEQGTKAWCFYNPITQRVHVSRDAVFEEDRPWDWGEEKGAGPNDDSEPFCIELITIGQACRTAGAAEAARTPPTSSAPTTPASTSSRAAMPTCGSEPRTPTATPPAPTMIQFASPPSGEPDLDDDHDEVPLRFRTVENVLAEREATKELLAAIKDEPATAEEAKGIKEWRMAMLEEMASIEENKTWTLVDLPKGQRVIGLKWVFKLKRDEHGEVVKHKARLIAKGYVQRQGIDFEEVFAPIARMESVRVVLAVAAHRGWSVHHMDVKSTFLNGELVEEVYVARPPGFTATGHEEKVLRLHKALYGLRQAPRAWNAKLDASLHELGFTRSKCEHGLYVRGAEASRLVVGVYVDDLIIMGEMNKEIDSFKLQMKKLFKMSDLEPLSYYLGIEVKQGECGIELRQSAYALKLLEKAGMSGCNARATPMEVRLKLSKASTTPLVDDPTMYRSIIGSLRVGYLSRFMEEPRTDHMAAVKHLLRYMEGTINYGLWYSGGGGGEISLLGYSDSDLAGDIDDRKSTTGMIFYLGANPVSWLSHKQRVVAFSSCEAEFIAGVAAACQATWLGHLIEDVIGKKTSPPWLKMDNMAAIALKSHAHDRSKHIDTKFHFIRECVDRGDINVEFVGTKEQLADILTKPLGKALFQELRERMGVIKLT
ncbi:LOW QUALITY PROTEIN: hypothetical protein U9M48_004308 [Paspalum notatum var. saurae]|uniref:Reverse transcriptase Ty1/copia-type domain-containing protein n=1 Tax=Paspalum notatum var. saurae TaxID=547442 RepID=A0AAQ3SEQ4_PASNO